MELRENYQLAVECGDLEKKAKELKERGFVEAIEGSTQDMRETYVRMIISKIEVKMIEQ